MRIFVKENFQTQFESIRSIMKDNIKTIRNLLDQSDNLSKIIHDLQNQNGTPEIISNLEKSKKEIEDSISKLAEQSDSLFETYQRLVVEVFGKQC